MVSRCDFNHLPVENHLSALRGSLKSGNIFYHEDNEEHEGYNALNRRIGRIENSNRTPSGGASVQYYVYDRSGNVSMVAPELWRYEAMQTDNDINRLTDLRILQTIVTAIEENQAPQPVVEAASDFIRLLTLCESDEYNGELWSYLTAHPGLARVSMLPTVQRIINGALEEVKRISQLSSGRPLTDEERHILHDVLLPLMQKVYAFNNWHPGAGEEVQ
jgi:hypothetical protein